jgi:hypothetical protein
MKIDWKYPKPRSGFLGSIDTVIGPGATKYEKLLICHILLSTIQKTTLDQTKNSNTKKADEMWIWSTFFLKYFYIPKGYFFVSKIIGFKNPCNISFRKKSYFINLAKK